MTQDDLIALMHTKENIVLSKNILSRMETGDRYITDLELMAFSRVLGIPIAWFLGETDDPRGLPAGAPGLTIRGVSGTISRTGAACAIRPAAFQTEGR